MKRLLRLSMIVISVTLLMLLIGHAVSAANPYYPIADTDTDITDPTGNYGSDPYIQLSASNVVGCVETSYLWYKFAIPATSQTIGDARLYLTTISAGVGAMDVELRSSSDTTWNENTLTWDTPQPALDPTVLSTAPGLTFSNTTVFSGTTFSSYLNAHRGQTVTLVVMANCSGAVGFNDAATVQTKENTNGSSVYLDLFTPTAITLLNFTALSASNSYLVLVAAVIAIMLIIIVLSVSRRRSRVTLG